MKKWIKRVGVGIVIAVIIFLGVYRFWLYPQYTVPILMYHYTEGGKGSLFVTPEVFEKQMKYLRDHHYHVISLDDLVAGKKAGKNFMHNTVVITFDDGAEDNYTSAFLILKKYRFPATFFIITRRLGKTIDGLSYLTKEQVREMSKAGIDIGSHTQHHVYLPDADTETIRAEVIGSKKDIERYTGKAAHNFCYPSGGFTPKAKEIIKEAGYLSASTTNRGYDSRNRDLYELTRVKVGDLDAVKPFHFWGKLCGYYNVFRNPKRGY